MLDFPSSGLTIGQVYAGTNGVTYIWTGTLWLASGSSAGGDFCAVTGAAVNLTTTPTPIVFSTVKSGNSGSWLNTSTGRFTPPAGRYYISAFITADIAGATGHSATLALRKNGVDQTSSQTTIQGSGFVETITVDGTYDANGTDFFDITGLATANSVLAIRAGTSAFTAFPISGIKGPPGDATPGTLLQTVSYQTGAVATGTTTTPIDDTIPQITEGTEFMTLAITPRSATSKLVITTNGFFCHTVATAVVVAALHRDSVANALAASWINIPSVNAGAQLTFTHTMTSGTTSPITFRYRAGANAAGTTTFNGQAATRTLGGVMASSIVIQEVAP